VEMGCISLLEVMAEVVPMGKDGSLMLEVEYKKFVKIGKNEEVMEDLVMLKCRARVDFEAGTGHQSWCC